MHPLLGNKKQCQACTARQDARQVVLPIIVNSPIMILGRNPGRDEDAKGVPFVGRGGVLLNEWIYKMGYLRNDFVIENVIACYTKGDRPPTKEEKVACGYWLLKEIKEFIKPKVIIALGNDAFRFCMQNDKPSVTLLHAIKMHSDLLGCDIIPLAHPGQALRDPYLKQKVEEEDLPKVVTLLKEYKEREYDEGNLEG